MNDFVFQNTTKVYFGKDQLKNLGAELKKCGVEYFDYYLLHNLNRYLYPKEVNACHLFDYMNQKTWTYQCDNWSALDENAYGVPFSEQKQAQAIIFKSSAEKIILKRRGNFPAVFAFFYRPSYAVAVSDVYEPLIS